MSHKIITEEATAFRGGVWEGRKVWEGSQKSAGEEKTVGGLGIWLLKASAGFCLADSLAHTVGPESYSVN